MKGYRITLSSWTASFRYPNLISGYQPSLVVPPLSTIYGLISAAAGNMCRPVNLAVGYVFKFEHQAIELETIYQFNKNPLPRPPNLISSAGKYFLTIRFGFIVIPQDWRRSFCSLIFKCFWGEATIWPW